MSGRHKAQSYYFDACIYLAYLQNDTASYSKRKIASIGTVWSRSERGDVAVMTSTVTITEVLSHKLSRDAEKKFFQAINFAHQVEDVTPPIALRAREYRDYYQKKPVQVPGGDKKAIRSGLTTPDAIHLATASINRCDEFWTFDGCAVGSAKKDIGLLWLGNSVGDDSLIICQPESGELELL